MDILSTSPDYQTLINQTLSPPSSNFSSPSTDVARAELAVLGLMFLVILIGNSLVITSLAVRRKKLTRMYFFILHVCIADLIVGFLQILPQFCWKATGRFIGNDFLCKSVKFGQMLGPYSSSYVLVAMAVDRYLAICFPLNSWVATKAKGMVVVAWVIAITCSSPQAILFNYEYVEEKQTWDCWVTFTEEQQRAYVTWYAVANTFVPLVVLVYTYSAICWAVWRNFRIKKDVPTSEVRQEGLLQRPIDQTHVNGACNLNKGGRSDGCNPRTHSIQRISRAKIKTVKLTVVVITCYIICCMPYTCAMLWVAYDTTAPQTEFFKGGFFSILALIASLNSCVNPWVYLAFNKNLSSALYHNLCCCCSNQQEINTRPITNAYSRTSISDTIAVQRVQLHPVRLPSNVGSSSSEEQETSLIVCSNQHSNSCNLQAQQSNQMQDDNAKDCGCEDV